jgi:hypothetical protein
MLMLEGAV